MKNQYQKAVKDLLTSAGIKINGNKSWDIRVKNEKFYKRLLKDGSVGLGESYMEGWWECPCLDEFFYRLFNANLEKKIRKNLKLKWFILKSRLLNMQSLKRSKKSISHHYDIGNELYREMLDPLMIYSCGYWQQTEKLSQAQENKLELICRKLKLKPGERVLDIGCGWGGFAYYAAKNYKVQVVGITISREQKRIAEERCRNLPIEIRLQDYREIDEKFDKIVSIGMLEHVGHKNYRPFMKIVKENLKDDGMCLLHFIGGNETKYNTDPWINKYIFPEGLIPSIAQIGKALEDNLILEDWHNFGLYYDKTLMAWHKNFQEAWPRLKNAYNKMFYKMWEFYLCASAASFRSKRLNLWQLVLTKKEFHEIYQSVRPQDLAEKSLVTS